MTGGFSLTERRICIGLILLPFWLAGCYVPSSAAIQEIAPTAVPVPPSRVDLSHQREVPTASATPETVAVSATASSARRDVATSTATGTSLPSPTLLPTRTPTATATPNLYLDLTIEALSNRAYGGGLVLIEETLERNDEFARYLITYPSDELTIYGYMNVPNEGDSFPVVILLHGYIDPEEYETVAYTRRYADALARAGYFVFHPNLRNYPPSDSGPDAYRTGYAIDVLNLIAIIRDQSLDITGTLRRVDADNINLWGHSMGGGVALRVITVNNAEYLRSAVLYGAMSGDEILNYQRILEWSGGNRGHFELSASPAMLREISPIFHLERIRAAISIHHSDSDDVVPVEWSEDLCQRLLALDQTPECYIYYGQPHTFRGHGEELFIDRFIAFFDRH